MSPRYKKYIDSALRCATNTAGANQNKKAVLDGKLRPDTTAEKGADKMSEERELRLFEIMDKLDIDMDAAELILQDEEEEHEREN